MTKTAVPTTDLEIRFDAPGPGSWFLLADHFPDPVTPQYAAIWIPTMEAANATLAERYGIPLAGIHGASLHGYLYLRGVPLVGSNSATLPPMWLLKLGVAIHPALRRCRRAAERALRDRPWRDVAEEWDRRVRPAWIDANLARQRVEPGACTDAELADHLVDCTDAWRDGYAIHFDYHGSDQLPIAAYVVRGEQLGLARDDLLAALTGWSPASLGCDAALDALRSAIRDAIGDDAGRLERVATLDELRELGPAVAGSLDAYVELHGWRMVTSYDLEGRALVELPAVILGRARAAEPQVDRQAVQAASERVADELRHAVPEEHRDELDRLLDDARVTYGLRDDNGAIVGAWPVGLARRAYLEAGRRLHAAGAIEHPDHVFELLADEVATLLHGGVVSTADLDRGAVAGRASDRRRATGAGAPLAIGPPMVAPDVSALPTAMALLTQAQVLVAEDSGFVDLDRADAVDGSVVVGTGIGTGTVHGIARVAIDPGAALAEIEPGEVLVARSTNPAWNAVLPLVTALVVEEGGALSHAGIMARELDLPTIIGAVGATSTLQTGDLVVIDVAAGTVRRAVAAPSTIGT
jgi:phosphohistidine swiveling domain-containing protein